VISASPALVGVFDSGVGGLSVLRQIRRLLPSQPLAFVADSRHVPYGDKTPEFIRQRSLTLARFLVERGARTIVVACNTATAAAAGPLRESLSVPVVAMEPAVKPAVAATRTRVIGVLATVGTLKSAQFAALLERFGSGVEVVVEPAPELVRCVEAGRLTDPATRTFVARYSSPLLAAGADTVVLGSTHFHFLRALVEDVVGPEVTVIDTGEAVALQLRRVLEVNGLLTDGQGRGSEEFWTSGDVESVRRVASLLWERPVAMHELPQALV
jgi:glutamate racemase